jgi:hypothetical protein
MSTAARHPSARAIQRAEERELRLAREAIAMVASGATQRVVVAGIRYGDEILDAARRIALESGVRVNPLRQSGTGRAALVVERIYE